MSPRAGSGANTLTAGTRPPFTLVEERLGCLRLSVLPLHLVGDRGVVIVRQGAVLRVVTGQVCLRIFRKRPMDDICFGESQRDCKQPECLARDVAASDFSARLEE